VSSPESGLAYHSIRSSSCDARRFELKQLCSMAMLYERMWATAKRGAIDCHRTEEAESFCEQDHIGDGLESFM